MSAATGATSMTIGRRSVEWGLAGGASLTLFYAVVVGFASGSVDHLLDQSRRDWYFLAPIIGGFATQVALVVELRARRRWSHREAVAGGTGTGASAVGMVACCAHHIADLLPLLSVTGTAGFLFDLRIPFMVAGIAVNALAITASVRQLRREGSARPDVAAGTPAEASCAAA